MARNGSAPGGPAMSYATKWELPPTEAFEELTKAFVLIPTHTKEQVPHGFEFVGNHLRDSGFAPHMIQANPTDVLVCRIGTHGPRVVWLGHVDTVKPARANHHVPVVRDGRVFGLGANDMKGPTAAILLAAPAIARVARDGGIQLEIVLVGDEEDRTPRHTVEDWAAQLVERPAAVWCGEPSRGLVSRASLGAMAVQVTVHGKPAHTARPYAGLDAIDWAIELRTLIRKAPLLRKPHVLFPRGPELHVSCIQGGNPRELSKVAHRCDLYASMRRTPDLSEAEILDEIARLSAVLPDGMSADIETIGPSFSPVLVEVDDPYFATPCQVVASELPPGAIPWTVQTGTADIGLLDPSIPMMEWSGDGGNSHAPDEYFVPAGGRLYAGHVVEALYRLGLRADA
jgi:succinyl-diaminopimelate desuccinylase